MRGGCGLKSLSCQYSALGILLKCTVEKYIMLIMLKEIILNSLENWWCWLCLCKVALLLLHMCRCKAKEILLSTVGFLGIIQTFKVNSEFYLSFHMLHASVPIRWGEDWGQAGCDDVCLYILPAEIIPSTASGKE